MVRQFDNVLARLHHLGSHKELLHDTIIVAGWKLVGQKLHVSWSEMTLNYRVMVEGYPNLKEEVGGSNPGYEISSLLDGKLARW